jgi:hypothetical protein
MSRRRKKPTGYRASPAKQARPPDAATDERPQVQAPRLARPPERR